MTNSQNPREHELSAHELKAAILQISRNSRREQCQHCNTVKRISKHRIEYDVPGADRLTQTEPVCEIALPNTKLGELELTGNTARWDTHDWQPASNTARP